MTRETEQVDDLLEPESAPASDGPSKRPTRRQFLGQAGVAATFVAGALATPPPASAQSTTTGSTTDAGAVDGSTIAAPSGVTNPRIVQAFRLRVSEAINDALVGPAVNVNNGDDALYPDKGGTYTKGLPHDAF